MCFHITFNDEIPEIFLSNLQCLNQCRSSHSWCYTLQFHGWPPLQFPKYRCAWSNHGPRVSTGTEKRVCATGHFPWPRYRHDLRQHLLPTNAAEPWRDANRSRAFQRPHHLAFCPSLRWCRKLLRRFCNLHGEAGKQQRLDRLARRDTPHLQCHQRMNPLFSKKTAALEVFLPRIQNELQRDPTSMYIVMKRNSSKPRNWRNPTSTPHIQHRSSSP